MKPVLNLMKINKFCFQYSDRTCLQPSLPQYQLNFSCTSWKKKLQLKFFPILGVFGEFQNENVSFFLEAFKNPLGDFYYFDNGFGLYRKLIEVNFSLLKIKEPAHKTSDYNCLLATINKNSKYIELNQVDCNSSVANSYFCIMDFLECKKSRNGIVEQLDLIFDPLFSEDQNYHIIQQTNNVHLVSKNFNLVSLFKNIFFCIVVLKHAML
jgi:hypothetical protein